MTQLFLNKKTQNMLLDSIIIEECKKYTCVPFCDDFSYENVYGSFNISLWRDMSWPRFTIKFKKEDGEFEWDGRCDGFPEDFFKTRLEKKTDRKSVV